MNLSAGLQRSSGFRILPGFLETLRFHHPLLRWWYRRLCVSFSVLLYMAVCCLWPLVTRARADQESQCKSDRIQLLHRTVAQDQGAWVIEYKLACGNCKGIILTPGDLSATIEGWVSNSRIASHTVPRLVKVSSNINSMGKATGEVITSSDESQQCRESLAICMSASRLQLGDDRNPFLISLAPEASLYIRLRIEHQHAVYGNYDPLLGIQSVKLSIASRTFCDRLFLDSEHYLAQPKHAWPEPPSDRRDTHHFVSPPDSLHLEAHVPGHQSFRYPECPVRYGTRMRLRFWYLVAAGTEGDCRVQLDQYKDTPTSWHPLTNSRLEQSLDVIGRWTKVEQVVRIENEATTVALGFRIISETNVGEMWVDNVSFEPLGLRSVNDP
jgi:hypothetical protein